MKKTNELKKGMRIKLRNGWYGTMADNLKGDTRMVDVEGLHREIGSVYSHDIIRVRVSGESKTIEQDPKGWEDIEYTPNQLKLAKKLNVMGMSE